MERRDRLVQEYHHDPYFVRERYQEPSLCKECGVVYQDGIFEWMKNPPRDAPAITCPACQRIRDDYEGGIVRLEGGFLNNHWDDIRNLIENTCDRETHERPLERILEWRNEDDGAVVIRTTYEHLARRIGEAVHKAYKGDLKLQYPGGEKYVRAHWVREQ
ncbi:MAG TPA: BCAM0308 family protein [Gammaproteobacteria bacterium]|nr:BCAM0308 family protein [Gammaproteobacteria bacterium]